jgi:hypothetical protein
MDAIYLIIATLVVKAAFLWYVIIVQNKHISEQDDLFNRAQQNTTDAIQAFDELYAKYADLESCHKEHYDNLLASLAECGELREALRGMVDATIVEGTVGKRCLVCGIISEHDNMHATGCTVAQARDLLARLEGDK